MMEEPLRGHRELYKAPGLAAPHWKEAYRRVGERSRGYRGALPAPHGSLGRCLTPPPCAPLPPAALR